jgi:hypothetical protein
MNLGNLNILPNHIFTLDLGLKPCLEVMKRMHYLLP